MRKALFVFLVVFFSLVIGYEFFNKDMDIQSDKITQEAPSLGRGAHLLLRNLNRARVVAPDRPHDPMELQNPKTREKIRRLREFFVSTNSMGFRSPELEKTKSKKRILCLGDSVTFGWGVQDEESYPSLLAKELNAEVINAGVPAMKPRHIAIWAKELNKLNPDIVLFARRPDWSNPNAFPSYQQAILSLKKTFPTSKIGLILPPVSSFDPRGLKQSSQELQEIQSRLSQIPLLDLTPIFHQNMPTKGYKLEVQGSTQVMLSRVDSSIYAQGTAQRGLAPEIIEAFESDFAVQEPLFFDGGHPDAEGFVLFSAQVAQWIKKQGWI